MHLAHDDVCLDLRLLYQVLTREQFVGEKKVNKWWLVTTGQSIEQKTKVMIMEDLKSNTNVNVYMVVFMYD